MHTSSASRITEVLFKAGFSYPSGSAFPYLGLEKSLQLFSHEALTNLNFLYGNFRSYCTCEESSHYEFVQTQELFVLQFPLFPPFSLKIFTELYGVLQD